jgi:hypothetical protein
VRSSENAYNSDEKNPRCGVSKDNPIFRKKLFRKIGLAYQKLFDKMISADKMRKKTNEYQIFVFKDIFLE